MDLEKENSKKKRLSTIFIIWLIWLVGNLCANSLFFMGDQYNRVFSVIGKIVYFITITGAGIVCAYHFSRQWKFSFNPIRPKKTAWLWNTILFAFILVMGYFAIDEQLADGFSFGYIVNHSLWWNLSPLFNLLPTMVAYTLLWYCLLLRTFQHSFKDNMWAKIISVILTAFFYSIYHFASVNEIFTLRAMLDEVMITFLISLALGAYIILTNNLVVLTIANLILNWFVFTPVASFHTTGKEVLLLYLIVAACIVVYCFFYKKQPNITRRFDLE